MLNRIGKKLDDSELILYADKKKTEDMKYIFIFRVPVITDYVGPVKSAFVMTNDGLFWLRESDFITMFI